MRVDNKLLAVGLSAAFLASGCGSDTHPEKQSSPVFDPTVPKIEYYAAPSHKQSASKALRVGSDQWVKVKKDVTKHYAEGDETLAAGEECVMVRGARLILKGRKVIYRNSDALGTECPDSTQVGISPKTAKAQGKRYYRYDARRQEVTDQVRQMIVPDSEPVKVSEDWVDLVNSIPVTQEYANAGVELSYGDTCLATGGEQKIGQLTTGEAVMRIENPGALGTECPTGALYLSPAGGR